MRNEANTYCATSWTLLEPEYEATTPISLYQIYEKKRRRRSIEVRVYLSTNYWKFQPELLLTFTELVVLNVAPPVAALSWMLR
jgi:hypothetical protein